MTVERAEPAEPYDLTRLPMGLDVDTGDVWTLSLWERHLLMGGVPGAGKSAGLNTLIALLAALPEVQVAGVDRKRGAEFLPWAPRMCRLATTLDEAEQLLRDVTALVDARYEFLTANGLRSAWGAEVYGDPRVAPLIVVVDELQLVLAAAGPAREDKAAAHERVRLLTELVLLARAAGVLLVVATQKPLADAIPTSIRDNVQTRVSFAVTTSAMADVILGAGSTQQGADPQRWNRPGMQGCATVAEEGSQAFRSVRCVYMTDADVAARAAATAHLRDDPWRHHPGTGTTPSGLHVPPDGDGGATALREPGPQAIAGGSDLARELFEEG